MSGEPNPEDSASERDVPDDVQAALSDPAVSDRDGWFHSEYTFADRETDEHDHDVAVREFARYADRLGVDESTVDVAESLYEQYVDRGGTVGIVELYAGAAFYCACKVGERAVHPDEVAEAGPELLTRKVLLRRSKRIASALGLNPSLFVDATQYVARYCTELGADDAVRQRAEEIVHLCEGSAVTSGKSPTGWAAAAVYLASRELGAGIRQHELAEVADVTEVTIRNRYQEQHEYLEGLDDGPDGSQPSAARGDTGSDAGESRTSESVQEQVAQVFDERNRRVTLFVQTALEEDAAAEIVDAVGETDRHVTRRLDQVEYLDSEALQMLNEIVAEANERVEMLVSTYERDDLEEGPYESVDVALASKIEETLERARDSAVEVTQTRVD